MTSLTISSLTSFGRHIGKETLFTSWELIKITVPVVILTKILEEAGAVQWLSQMMAPLLNIIGLPGELGLVWATAMATTLYGGMAVFAALAPGLDLTVAQVTVLCSAMLIAHSLPLELTVSTKAGANLWPIAALRIGGALIYGFLLDRFCLAMDIWQEKIALIFAASNGTTTLLAWGLQQLYNLGLIIVVIFCTLVVMQLLRQLGILTFLEKNLAPALPKFGMGEKAAPITVVGMIMGLGYGGALIIREATTNGMEKKEIFYAMALMGLCHGLVEDTVLMMALGGKLGGIFWGRIVFSLAVIYLLVKIVGAILHPARTSLYK